MAGLLPLIFILVIAETSAEAMPLHQPACALAWWWWPLVLGASLTGWLLLGEICTRLVARRGSWRIMAQTELALQGGILLWYAWLCYGWGWSHYHQIFSMALLPWLGVQTAHWWSQAHAVRAVTGHPWTRFGRVLYQWRFGVLPVVLILPLFDVGAWLAVQLDIERFYSQDHSGLLLMALSVQAFLLAVLTLLPVVLVWLWGAKPLDQGPLSTRLHGLCDAMGVRVAGLMRWPVPGGRIYNAAVIGLVPRFRYVLFTDELVHDLEPGQLTAVLGHELGHVRHGHLWLYFLFATLVVLVVSLIQPAAAELVRPLFEAPPKGVLPMNHLDPWGSISRGIASLVLLALLWRLLFGYVSRACERQADLAGAQLAGDPLVMASALKTIAQLAGQPEHAPSWRHYSIAQRVAFMEQVHARPSRAALHHRTVSTMRNLLIALCCAIAAVMAVEFWFNPAAMTSRDPLKARQELARWVDLDPDLGLALAAADRGDTLPLSSWINRAGDFERERLLRTLLISGRDDIRTTYRDRHRLRPFLNLSSGKPALDAELDNDLAYALVAGCAEPTAQDVAIATSIAPRLEAQVKRQPDHALLDTLGCISFATGDFTRAAEHFSAASAAVANEPRVLSSVPELYRRRQQAARTNAAGGLRVPLPKDWPGIPAEAPPPAATSTPPTP